MVACCTILLVLFLTFLCRKHMPNWFSFSLMVCAVVAYTIVILHIGGK